MTRVILAPLLTVSLLLGCGGSDDAGTSTDTSTSGGSASGGGASDERCEGYTPGDACIDEDSFASCQAMAAQCPGQVQVAESCPLQFSCPAETGGASDCEFDMDDPCYRDANIEQCREMSAQCPGAVRVLESCPVQFACP